jgi:outer membrane protein
VRALASVLLLAALAAPRGLVAQSGGHADHPWTLRARALLVGANAESDPVGLDVYGAFTVEADISRRFGRHFAAELILASASHEVTSMVEGVEVPLGSVELLPPTLLAQYHFLPDARVHPYIGAGVNLSVFYEKSGDLDALDLATKVAPAAQAGADVDLSDRMVLNFDVKWIWLETTLENEGASLAELTIDPFILGAGVGFRF